MQLTLVCYSLNEIDYHFNIHKWHSARIYGNKIDAYIDRFNWARLRQYLYPDTVYYVDMFVITGKNDLYFSQKN
jgi:hypothetical protein